MVKKENELRKRTSFGVNENSTWLISTPFVEIFIPLLAGACCPCKLLRRVVFPTPYLH